MGHRLIRTFILCTCLTIMLFRPASGEDCPVDFQGELLGWTDYYNGNQQGYQLGVRYLPALRLNGAWNKTWQWDGEAVGNLQVQSTSQESQETDTEQTGKIYRLWGRAFTDQLGIRLGRQEIAFGPGKMLRSMRWFDQKDSRDPTGFSEGVNALLVRYYFQNNANIWFWTLAGNTDPMGISPFKTAEDTPETGGRFQIPLGTLEMAVSFHHREIDTEEWAAILPQKTTNPAENRIGFDFSWDLGVGIYLESCLIQFEKTTYLPRQQVFATFGTDYTFDVGDGLNANLEVMSIDSDTRNTGTKTDTVWIEAASAQYPLNLLDQIQLLVFHTQLEDITIIQGIWSRTYDNLVLNTIAYASRCPDRSAATVTQANTLLDATCQDGVRLMVQYNH